MDNRKLRDFLDEKVNEYNHPAFIKDDPVSIPHRYSKKQDIEIAGLFAAIFAWGNRTTIIRKSLQLMEWMDDAPYDFCMHHQPADLRKLTAFRHRTFNATDLFYFIGFLKHHYSSHASLEDAFTGSAIKKKDKVQHALNNFYGNFFSMENAPQRTRKHIACPEKNSTCKRLNMYLRWMVRKDDKAVDFGIWKKILPSELICPIDLHVSRIAKKLGLITRSQNDWLTAVELTGRLRILDPKDPVKYDFALFSLGAVEKY